jgi:sugar lactone lactonase YvrE
MRGLKSAGDADGIGMPSASNVYDVSNATATGNTFSVATQSASLLHMTFSPDGTKFYVIDYTNGYMMQYGCTTAFDLTTASYSSKTFYSYQQDGQPAAARFNPAGTSMFIAGRNNDRVYQYSLSTAYDISTASYSTSWAPSSGKVNAGFADILFNNDGSFIYTLDYNTDVIGQFACPNEYQLSGVSSDSTYEYSLPTNSIATPQGMSFNSDGTKMYIIATNNKIDIYTLSTAYRVSTMSYSSTISINGGNMALDFSADGTKLFVASRESDNIIEYSVGEIFTPTSQYHVAVTNSGGQIDTSNWLDLNTMVADQAAGDGTVHYAVSTDDRTTWSVIKEGSGVRPIVRDNSGTWQYNSDAGSLTGAYDLSTAVFNKSKSVASDTSDPYGIIFKPDGTKMFVLDDGFAAADDVLEYGLSTAWDISTATFTQAYRLLSSEAAVQGMDFKSDGTQVYVVGSITDAVYAYDLSTAWDISTASYNSVNFSTTSQTTTPFAVKFKADGAKMYVIGSAQDTIYEYNLSTSWDISTASYNNVSYYFNSQVAAAHNLTFNSAGTKLYLAGSGAVYEYNLSTAWDLSSISYSNVSFSVSESEGITFKPDGTKMFMCGSSNDLVVEYDIGSIGYGTSTTWANSTTNDEFYALQQALGYNAFNRMDKTQLDAVTDPNHYTLGDTLDLAIALRMDTASASTPTADGVTINYDAASLNQGAVLGTDYDYDFPDSTTVRVTSNAAQNLKVRVV